MDGRQRADRGSPDLLFLPRPRGPPTRSPRARRRRSSCTSSPRTILTFSHQDNSGPGAYGRAFQSGAFLAERGRSGSRFHRGPLSPWEETVPILPADRNFRYIFANVRARREFVRDVELRQPRFAVRGFQPRPANLRQGRRFDDRAGRSAQQPFAEAEWSGGIRFSDDAFAQTDVDVQSRFDGVRRTRSCRPFSVTSRRFRLVSMPQTFVARAQYDQAWRELDQDVQFEASGPTGLRGYELHSMEGDKRLLFNPEQRFFSEREYLQLFSPGRSSSSTSARRSPRASRSRYRG